MTNTSPKDRKAYFRERAKKKYWADPEAGRARGREIYYKAKAKNPSKVSARDKAAGKARYASLSREQRLFEGFRNHARRRGEEFSLSLGDIVIPAFCPILNIQLLTTRQTRQDASPTLVRLDESKPWAKDNVCVISWRARCLLSRQTYGELKSLARWNPAKS